MLTTKTPRNSGLLVLLLSLLLTACANESELTPEAAVKATLKAIEEAAEARTLSGFMSHVSEEYQDHEGNSWEDIQRLVQFEYIRNQNIHIFTNITRLDITENVATVELNVAMASTAAALENQSARLRADTHHFSLVLRGSNDQQTWMVESVAWRRGWQ